MRWASRLRVMGGLGHGVLVVPLGQAEARAGAEQLAVAQAGQSSRRAGSAMTTGRPNRCGGGGERGSRRQLSLGLPWRSRAGAGEFRASLVRRIMIYSPVPAAGATPSSSLRPGTPVWSGTAGPAKPGLESFSRRSRPMSPAIPYGFAPVGFPG
jgi:hypothetical protein